MFIYMFDVKNKGLRYMHPCTKKIIHDNMSEVIYHRNSTQNEQFNTK